jgi:geranylgeranyl pyrophosphate synthase
MIEASLVMGGIVGGASDTDLGTLRETGRHLGMAFQIIDDILDATADSATLGKTAGKDAQSGKTTYVTLHGVEAARRIADRQTLDARAALARLPGDAEFLLMLASTMASRSK